ncbi:glycoside hydrolase [Armillaria fumosa]|nr:glycoside hydrolase [Armillaria fumosa]
MATFKRSLGSTKYTGYLPYSDPYYNLVPQRIVRQIPSNGPVEDLTLIDLQCNGYMAGDYYTAPAPIYRTVAAGSKVALNWTTWPDSHKGPMITYMARAPDNVNITAWSPGTSAVWFKVTKNGKTSACLWAATDLLTASNSAQFYPSCIQVQVTGSGNAYPTSFMSFPGAYTPSTPGIVFDIYTDTSVGVVYTVMESLTDHHFKLAYPIPGPAVWTG